MTKKRSTLLKELPKKVKVSSDVVSRKVEGEEVILNLASGIYFGLDEMGTHIWNSCVEQQKPESLIDDLSQEYSVSKEQCQNDLLHFYQQLEEKGLLQLTY